MEHPPILKRERWVFTQAEIENGGNGCRRDDCFFASIPGSDVRVVMMRNGQATRQYSDGSLGVTPEDSDEAESQETLYAEDGTPADEWRDVIADRGKLVSISH